MKKFAIGLALAAVTLAGGALAAETVPARGDWANKTMTRADAGARAAKLFDKFDANHDGKIDPADRAARQGLMFDRVDTDRNGSLSPDEFIAMHQRGAMAGHGMAGMNHGPDGMDGMKHHGMGGHRMGGRDRAGGMGDRAMMRRMADANGDGALTKAEFIGAALKRFDMTDTDRNGTVTAAERQAAHARMQAQRDARGDADAPRPGA